MVIKADVVIVILCSLMGRPPSDGGLYALISGRFCLLSEEILMVIFSTHNNSINKNFHHHFPPSPRRELTNTVQCSMQLSSVVLDYIRFVVSYAV